jgi:hypothetical protein
MTDVETKRKFIEELRGRLLAEESELLLECWTASWDMGSTRPTACRNSVLKAPALRNAWRGGRRSKRSSWNG